jgi:hypothetical protein
MAVKISTGKYFVKSPSPKLQEEKGLEMCFKWLSTCFASAKVSVQTSVSKIKQVKKETSKIKVITGEH